MIKGTGVDIVKLERIEKIVASKRDYFLEKIFTSTERNYIIEKKFHIGTIGGMFAAKEAVSKVFGLGIGKIGWKDIEVLHDEKGKPCIMLRGNAAMLANEKGIENIHLSITHEKEYSVAYAIGEGNCNNEVGQMNINSIKDEEMFKEFLPIRRKDSHKGTYGRIGVIAGSKGMTGALYLSTLAALRSGSGLVYGIVPESLSTILSIKAAEVIIKPVEDEGKGFFNLHSLTDVMKIIEDMDTIALGPGLGVDDERIKFVEEILKNTDKPIVLDADGINCCSLAPDILQKKKGELVITPHPGELARLLGVSIGEIQKNREKYAKLTSENFNVITVLKGSNTIVADKEGTIYVNKTGNPGMATAGSGDVLTGIISSFIGQGIESKRAAMLGVYLHGVAGDLAKSQKGEYGIIASDIVEYIPYAIMRLESDNRDGSHCRI